MYHSLDLDVISPGSLCLSVLSKWNHFRGVSYIRLDEMSNLFIVYFTLETSSVNKMAEAFFCDSTSSTVCVCHIEAALLLCRSMQYELTVKSKSIGHCYCQDVCQ